MNRQQQRQNLKDQKRLEQRQKARKAGNRPSQPALSKRPTVSASSRVPVAPVKSGRAPLPRWVPWATAVVVLAAFVGLFFLVDPFGLRTPLPGAKVPTQGNNHVNPGDFHVAYKTDPPASGPHFPTVPRRGTYIAPLTTEYLPHFLEHGGVEVLYNSSASPELVKTLSDFANKEIDKQPGNVLFAPRPDMPCEVTATAWGRMEAWGGSGCNQPGYAGHEFNAKTDIGKLKEFVERNQCQYDPENTCGGGQHGSVDNSKTPAPGEPTVQAALGTATPAATGTPAAGPLGPGPLSPTAAPTP